MSFPLYPNMPSGMYSRPSRKTDGGLALTPAAQTARARLIRVRLIRGKVSGSSPKSNLIFVLSVCPVLSRLIKRLPSPGDLSFAAVSRCTSGCEKKQGSCLPLRALRFFVLALKQTPQLRPQLPPPVFVRSAGNSVIGECQSRECDLRWEIIGLSIALAVQLTSRQDVDRRDVDCKWYN